MEYVELGRSGLRVSIIGLGAWQFGSREWGWGREFSKEQALATVSRALDLGVNFIDTAEVYGGGLSEEIVGEALRGRRDGIVIATKVSPWNLAPWSVRKAAERSLRRLGVSEIDLYQIHWPNPFIPLQSTMRAMERLIQEGKVRHIGVSNFNTGRLKRAQEALASHEVVSDQMKYNMLHRSIEDNLLPFAQKENISIIAYSPLAQGALTGKYEPDKPIPRGVRIFNAHFTPQNLQRLTPLIKTLRRIGEKHDKTISQVALNWLLREPLVVPIPGAKSPSQMEDNAGGAGWRLSSDELDSIEKALQAFRPERIFSTLMMLQRALFSR